VGAGIAQSVKRQQWDERPRNLGIRSRQRHETLLFSTASRPVLGPTQGTGKPSPGAKRQEHEADHSPPPTAEVRNGGAVPLPPLIGLHGIVLN
jgi:hypothetical protein